MGAGSDTLGRRDALRVIDQAVRAQRNRRFLERLDEENTMAEQFPELAVQPALFEEDDKHGSGRKSKKRKRTNTNTARVKRNLQTLVAHAVRPSFGGV